MATIAIVIGGAILNATAFIGGNYLAKALGGNSAEESAAEKKDMTLLRKALCR